MRYKIKKTIACGLILLIAIIFKIAFAGTVLNPGEVQLSVAGILLDVEGGSPNILDEISFTENSFTITLSASQLFKVSSIDRRAFNVSPTDFVKKDCSLSKSSLTIQTPSGSATITYTITPLSSTCSADSGGIAQAPPPPPPPTEQPPAEQPPPPTEAPSAEVSPAKVPPEELPPTEAPPAELLPAEIPPEEQPPTLTPEELVQAEEAIPLSAAVTVEAVQQISLGVATIVNSITTGITEIFQGVKTGPEVIVKVNEATQRVVKELRTNPAVTKTVKEVATPVSVTVTAAGAGALAVTASTGSATVAINLSQIFNTLSLSRFYLLGLIRFKRRKPWGRVIDKLSGKPLQGATIQIYESEFKKLKDSQITDAEGRFSALVGPGKYFIKVVKKGYQDFQSQIVDITTPDQILNLELSLSPLREEWDLKYIKRINILNAIKRVIGLLNPYLLALGTFISAISLIIVPNFLNYTTFIIYLVLDILKIYFAIQFIKPYGTVVAEDTKEPLPLTVVRIFDADKNWLLATKVTDNLGRFSFLLAPDKYYLSCSRSGFITYVSEPLVLKKAGLSTLDVKLQRHS